MRYYVCSDLHGFYTPFIEALKSSGYFEDEQPHKLLILGDIMDRGEESVQMQEFILKKMEEDAVILVKGNHEDLFTTLVWDKEGCASLHDYINGTYHTMMQLSDHSKTGLIDIPFYKTIIPSMIDYYETDNYIFVHGYLPGNWKGSEKHRRYVIYKEWRDLPPFFWKQARWINGMDASITADAGKTVVCGHWNCSYGHSKLDGDGSEYGEDANHSPYYGTNVIAIDACTAASGMVNVLIIDD